MTPQREILVSKTSQARMMGVSFPAELEMCCFEAVLYNSQNSNATVNSLVAEREGYLLHQMDQTAFASKPSEVFGIKTEANRLLTPLTHTPVR